MAGQNFGIECFIQITAKLPNMKSALVSSVFLEKAAALPGIETSGQPL